MSENEIRVLYVQPGKYPEPIMKSSTTTQSPFSLWYTASCR